MGNYALAGSTSKDACMNTKSTCPNVPMGGEMLLDQYLTCGADCVRSCTAQSQMLTGTCTDAGSGTACIACTGSCRMDMSVSITLYMTNAEFTPAKNDLLFSALNLTMSVPTSAISIVSVTESSTMLVASKYITVVAKISLKSGTSGGTSATPIWSYSALKTKLLDLEFTSKVTSVVGDRFGEHFTDRFGEHFTDKGTVLDMAQPIYTEVLGIIGSNSTSVVTMVVQMSYALSEFDEAKQSKFKTAVANAVVTPVDNVVINSMIEVTTRRVSRKLLATAVEIDFSVRVADKAAASALVSSGSLDKDKLDAELVNQGLTAISKVVSAAKASDSSIDNNSTAVFSTAHRAVPSIFAGVFAMCFAIVF